MTSALKDLRARSERQGAMAACLRRRRPELIRGHPSGIPGPGKREGLGIQGMDSGAETARANLGRRCGTMSLV